MGEIAEMMLDGTLCSSCGEYLGSDADGYPIQCLGCEGDDAERTAPKRAMGKATKKLLLTFFFAGKQLEITDANGQIHSLVLRGFVEQASRWGYYKLTDEGRWKAKSLLQKGGAS